MSLKWNSTKSVPRPPHVCKAPIPGNPQPAPGAPEVIQGTWVFSRLPPYNSILYTYHLTWIITSGGYYELQPTYSPEGIKHDSILVLQGAPFYCSAQITTPDTPFPYPTTGWNNWQPTTETPWFRATLDQNGGNGYSLSKLTLYP